MARYGLKDCVTDIKSDLKMLGRDNAVRSVLMVLFRPQFKFLASIRINRFLKYNRWLRPLLPWMEWRQFRRFSSQVSPVAEIGRGVRFPHPTGILIGVGVRVEDGVTIFQQVTLGGKAIGGNSESLEDHYPSVERGATLYTGAKILGGVRIGADAIVGANAVVVRDVPPGAVALGIPAVNRMPKPDVKPSEISRPELAQDDGSKKADSLGKSSLLVFLTKITNIFAGIFATLLISRALGPEGNGLYTVAFGTINMINTITALGVNRTLTVMYARKDYDLRTFYGNALTLLLGSSLLAVLAVAVTFFFGPVQKVGWFVLVPALCCIPFMLTIDYGQGIFLAKQQMRSFNASTLQRYLGYVCALVILLFVVKAGLISVTMGFFIGTMMGALSPILRLRSEAVVPLRFDRDVMKAMLTQGAQYAFGAAVIVFNLRINVLILEQSVPYTQVGLFGNGSNLVEAIWQIPTSIGIVLTGKSANAESVEAAVQQTVKAFRAVFPVTILAGLVLALLAGPITLLFFGEKLKTAGPNAYETAVTCIHLLIPGVLLGVIYKVFGADLVGRGKPLFAAKAYLVALVVNVILSLWLIRVQGMGIIGASIANSISYCVGALLFFRSYQREYHVKLQDAFVPRLSDYRPLLKKLRLAR